jgi:Na+-transporting NADH:ubiquinone oxidoreductase subunit NqrC
MRNKGELERYNSLKAKEQKEDERIEQQLVDLNTGVQKQPQAVHQSRVQITRTITSMIDKKKVVMDNVSIKSTTNIINHKNIEIEKTTTTTTIQPSSLHH